MDLLTNSLRLAATTVTAETKPQDDWGLVFSSVVTGLVVVFFILAILVCVLYAMGAILGEKKKKTQLQETAETAVAEPVVVTESTEDFEDNDEEIIAVISAAIAAYGAQDGVQYTIKKIKRADKQPRSNWGTAGVTENTRPF